MKRRHKNDDVLSNLDVWRLCSLFFKTDLFTNSVHMEEISIKSKCNHLILNSVLLCPSLQRASSRFLKQITAKPKSYSVILKGGWAFSQAQVCHYCFKCEIFHNLTHRVHYNVGKSWKKENPQCYQESLWDLRCQFEERDCSTYKFIFPRTDIQGPRAFSILLKTFFHAIPATQCIPFFTRNVQLFILQTARHLADFLRIFELLGTEVPKYDIVLNFQYFRN